METPEAQKLIAQLVDDPGNWDIRCKAAEMLSMEGRNGEAVSLLDAAEGPPEFETHILKVVEIYSKTSPGKVVPLLHAFLEQVPDSAMGHLAMAEVAGKLGDTDGAAQYYQCALDINKAYRDPDFEAKYGIKLAGLPPAMTGKTQTVPLPDAADLPKADDEFSLESDDSASAKSGGRKPKSRASSWIVATLTAIGVFVICWLVLLAILKAFLQS